tara:strand:- start:438 stop:569 length:132 start_codon:yes stop_codon:yes gene_type:complete
VLDINIANFNDNGENNLSLCNRSSIEHPGAGPESGDQPRLLLC